MRHAAIAIGLALACQAGSAEAQVSYGQTRGRYGGGLIELLMGGPNGGPAIGPAPPRGRTADPFGEPQAPYPQAPYPQASYPQRAYPQMGLASMYQRQTVAYGGPEAPGTIIVDTPSKLLYHVQPGGRATRYGIGVGRPGFMWAGIKTVTMKREWPDWTPPPDMIRRRPDLPRHMAGGPENPLGARAMYLGSSLYRIHGTNEPGTIGQNVSSGCIRMMNEDVIDLYNHVRVGTTVKVI